MTEPAARLTLDPARLFPAGPQLRDIAERLYGTVRDRPNTSLHGHVDPRLLLEDAPFADPTSLLLQPDHDVTRLLRANGVSLAKFGAGEGPLPEAQARAAWRLLCANWRVVRGTPMRYWFAGEVGEIFGVTERPNADQLYDQIRDIRAISGSMCRRKAVASAGPVHPGRRRVQPGDHSARRVLSVRVRWRTVVVPGQSVRDPWVSTVGHRNRRLLRTVRFHRRHPRVLLHPGPA